MSDILYVIIFVSAFFALMGGVYCSGYLLVKHCSVFRKLFIRIYNSIQFQEDDKVSCFADFFDEEAYNLDTDIELDIWEEERQKEEERTPKYQKKKKVPKPWKRKRWFL